MDGAVRKTAIVTGGASGMGRALCERLGRRGVAVLVADIDEGGARTVADGVRAEGGVAESLKVDVSDADSVQALIRHAVERGGRLDYLFNNAGVVVAGDQREIGLAEWRRLFGVNFWGALHGSKFAYDVMARQGAGHIVNTASIAGLMPSPMNTPYCASKYAIVGLSLSLRAEGRDLGVKVSVVCPGLVLTNIFRNGVFHGPTAADILAHVPVRGISPDRAAEHILRGVDRNRAIICFPLHARLVWWLYRHLPGLYGALALASVRKFRALRHLKADTSPDERRDGTGG